ncbi:hypothetical protein HLB23_31295 [Nocardia uniformis]|uniref:Uncharacterized protein n=1 Tax=Nocardia uniformis TaxID=53432 RepID=A0A849C6C3_9NOCA|nr:hypothetical protein [Nocardia uniformis]NNH74283.1 hypothetical protein [Nocardia uniformis]
MAAQVNPSETPDPRAHWRQLPAEPGEWIEEKATEPSSSSYTPEPDAGQEAARYSG